MKKKNSVADPDPQDPYVLSLPDPDPLDISTRTDPDHHAKIVRKTLIPTVV
jgi:hypothetical protein